MDTDNKTMSPSYNAPTGNPGPQVFDGFRFAKLRDLPGNDSKHQSVTTGLVSITHLSFPTRSLPSEYTYLR